MRGCLWTGSSATSPSITPTSSTTTSTSDTIALCLAIIGIVCIALGYRRRTTSHDRGDSGSNRWGSYEENWEYRERFGEEVNRNDNFLEWLVEPREPANTGKQNPKRVQWRVWRIPQRNRRITEFSFQTVPNASAGTQPYPRRLWTR